jgi:hypothetical protein
MPLYFAPNRQEKIERVRMFVSEDRGKTWQHQKDYKSTDEFVAFTASRDDHYWFALQVLSKDGSREPAELRDLAPAMKVYVNTRRNALKPIKSYAELQHEVDELRRTIAELQMRIKELESERKPK